MRNSLRFGSVSHTLAPGGDCGRKFRDQSQDVGDQIPWDCNLGHLEGDAEIRNRTRPFDELHGMAFTIAR
jgi:hypothetical protein